MQTIPVEKLENQTPANTRLRAVVEIIGGELAIYPICDNDGDERHILDA
jgi:hypothetical protein